ITFHSFSLQVCTREVVLRFGIAFLSCLKEPLESFVVTLIDTAASAVHLCNTIHAFYTPLFCRLEVVLECIGIALFDSTPLLVELTKSLQTIDIILIC